MTPLAYRLTAVLFGVLLLGLNVSLKREISFEELQQATAAIRQPRFWDGKVAPEIEVLLRDGTKFRLSEHVGRRIVILNFFATWCKPCREEMPELGRYVSKSAGRPVILVGIDSREQPDVVDRFVKDVKVSFPVGIDESGEIGSRLGVRSFPTTILVGVDGRIALYEAGAIFNADVAFDPFVKTAEEALKAGRGISVETWRREGAAESSKGLSVEKRDSRNADALSGRAAEIAAHMRCACGCEHLLKDCTCGTANEMKKKLRQGAFGDRTNAQVAEDLNREFCMKGM